ncbi:MAG TPA: hypothetical protein VFN25_14325 [Dokdonella sp.]|uniref:hypothetical protein n=1 Tax=Dokdonella sp. TaxID=2291710 RepID=UPI002D7F5856|nr:hypothetical protein [Dokdonella sp.]HET9034066.1 hypothetical protein [Dokdonella sp.]
MTLRILFPIGIAIILSLVFDLPAQAYEIMDSDNTTFCVVAKNPELYEGKVVVMKVQAKEAGVEYGIILVSAECPGRGIFVEAGSKFLENKDFMTFMRKMYPRFPDDDEYTDEVAEARVKGKIVRLENHDLLMTYLQLQEIEVE